MTHGTVKIDVLELAEKDGHLGIVEILDCSQSRLVERLDQTFAAPDRDQNAVAAAAVGKLLGYVEVLVEVRFVDGLGESPVEEVVEIAGIGMVELVGVAETELVDVVEAELVDVAEIELVGVVGTELVDVAELVDAAETELADVAETELVDVAETELGVVAGSLVGILEIGQWAVAWEEAVEVCWGS